jgi:hypothetical protein
MTQPRILIAVAAVIAMAVTPGWVSAQEGDDGGDGVDPWESTCRMEQS